MKKYGRAAQGSTVPFFNFLQFIPHGVRFIPKFTREGMDALYLSQDKTRKV